jgi:hypothetical protein
LKFVGYRYHNHDGEYYLDKTRAPDKVHPHIGKVIDRYTVYVKLRAEILKGTGNPLDKLPAAGGAYSKRYKVQPADYPECAVAG